MCIVSFFQRERNGIRYGRVVTIIEADEAVASCNFHKEIKAERERGGKGGGEKKV
jgi:hypothetical protein